MWGQEGGLCPESRDPPSPGTVGKGQPSFAQLPPLQTRERKADPLAGGSPLLWLGALGKAPGVHGGLGLGRTPGRPLRFNQKNLSLFPVSTLGWAKDHWTTKDKIRI